MNEIELFNRALYYSATVHQPHAIKTYLAAKNIDSLIKNDAIWEQADQLISKSEVYIKQTFVENIEAPKFSQQRIKGILKRGIYPVAYSALLQWYSNRGFQDVFNYYLEEATIYNEYLSHNITILLSFYEISEQLSEQQIYPFLDRVTEFLTSTFGYNSHPVVSKTQNYLISDEVLLQECLTQPSFFGHNLITLAWLIRFEAKIPFKFLHQLKMNLHIQATTPLEDEEDEIDQALFQLCLAEENPQFMKSIHELIFGVCKNLHQVTMADALLFLQQRFPEYTQKLSYIADYQVRILKRI